jgi:hypothetical protein
MNVNASSTALQFDATGRLVPNGMSAPAHVESRHWFAFRQPTIDYAAIYQRAQKHLADGRALTLTSQEFEARALAIHAQLQADPALSPITQGVGVPFLLPADSLTDYGSALETRYLPAVQAAFKATLPQYDFNAHHPARLDGKLSVDPGSRHEKLLKTVRDNDVVGWFYPSLREYSIHAMREATALLPDNILLAGGIDTCAALVGTPDLLLREDGYPPLIWLGAMNTEKDTVGYHFEAYGYNLTFNRRAHLGQAAEYWAGAVVVLG